jgi:hypothetical protein
MWFHKVLLTHSARQPLGQWLRQAAFARCRTHSSSSGRENTVGHALQRPKHATGTQELATAPVQILARSPRSASEGYARYRAMRQAAGNSVAYKGEETIMVPGLAKIGNKKVPARPEGQADP